MDAGCGFSYQKRIRFELRTGRVQDPALAALADPLAPLAPPPPALLPPPGHMVIHYFPRWLKAQTQ